MEVNLYTALASLGYLMGAITRDVISPKEVSFEMVKVYSRRLSAWHESVASTLTLSTAVKDNYERIEKNLALLLHCAYLGSIIQLFRRLLVDRVKDQLAGSISAMGPGLGLGRDSSGARGEALADANATAEDYTKMCVTAARQLATVCGCGPPIGSQNPSTPHQKKVKKWSDDRIFDCGEVDG